MWVSMFFVVFITLLAIPYIPALREIRKKSDVAPLTINQSFSSEVQYFARQFAAFKQREQTLAFISDDYRILGAEDVYTPTRSELRKSEVYQLLSAEGDLTLPDGVTFFREVSSRGNLTSGTGGRYYSLLSEKTLTVRKHSIVERWAHGKCVVVDKGVFIKARLSADQEIVIHPETIFGKLHAPLIRFMRLKPDLGDRANITNENVARHAWSDVACQEGTRYIVNNDLYIPPMSVVETDLIVRGDIYVGHGTKIEGSVKAYGDLELEAEVIVLGSLISQKNIVISSQCRVLGPVVAEGEGNVGSDTIIGTLHKPTTMSAYRLKVGKGVVVHGSICVIGIINDR